MFIAAQLQYNCRRFEERSDVQKKERTIVLKVDFNPSSILLQ